MRPCAAAADAGQRVAALLTTGTLAPIGSPHAEKRVTTQILRLRICLVR